MREKFLRILGRLGLMLTSIILMLFLFEILLRIFFPQQLIVLRPDVYYPVEGLGYQHHPDVSTTFNAGERTVQLYTDEHGYRIGENDEKEPADFRILAIGDSFLEAIHVEHEETMTALLAEKLSEETGQRVSVTNTGVAGYTPNNYLAMTRRALAEDEYDMVLVFIYTANDIVSEKIDPVPAERPVVHHNLRFPKALNRREIIDSVLYPISDFLESHSHLYIATRNASSTLLAGLGLTGAYFPEVLLKEKADVADWGVTASILNDIEDEAFKRDIPIVFVLLPANIQIDSDEYEWYQTAFDIDPAEVDLDQPYRILSAEMAKYDLTLLSTAPALRDAYVAGEDNLYGRIHKHFNAPGHRVVADYLAPILTEHIRGD